MSEPQDTPTPGAPGSHPIVVEKPSRILGLFPPELWDRFLQNVIEKHSVILLIAGSMYLGYKYIYVPESQKADARSQRLEAVVSSNTSQIHAIQATAEAQQSIAASMDNSLRTLERLSDRADRRASPPN